MSAIGEACSLDVTVSEIARRAGVSSALAHHYFGGKDDLFLAAMRDLLSVYGRDAARALAQAQTPRERLTAIVRVSFAPAQFHRETVAAWTIFYVKAQSAPRYARLLSIYVRRLRANLMHELRQLAVAGEAEQAAEAIGSMIDGLYLRQGLSTKPADSDQCVAITERLIDSWLLEAR